MSPTPVLSPFNLTFGLTLALLFIFGLGYAALVRLMARRGVQGQTAYTVVGGVAVTVLGATALIGWHNVILLLACFTASGLPMILEYGTRTHGEQRRDLESAQAVAKELLG